jgi:hypothetical protein
MRIGGQKDTVPGKSYVVKGSGFATPWHPQDLGIIFGLAPKS